MARAVQVENLLNGIYYNGDPLASGKVYTYSAGTLSNKTTWTAIDKSASAANPIILDANGKAQVYADGLYKFVITDSDNNTIYTQDNLFFGLDDGTLLDGGTSTGAANTYVITVAPAPSAYATGQYFRFISHQANTGAATANVSSLGAKNIVTKNNQTLQGGEIPNGAVVELYYDGTSLRLVSTAHAPRVTNVETINLINTGSATHIDMTGLSSAVTVNSGDQVKLTCSVQWSVDNIDTLPEFRFAQNGSVVGQVWLYRSTGDVGSQGNHRCHSNTYVITAPTTGSVTYSVQWRRQAGANVCYSLSRSLIIEVFRP